MNTTPKTAGLIIIGNEVLSGKTKDANLQFLANYLRNLGIDFIRTSVIKDHAPTIIQEVQFFSRTLDYVFTTGGIGTTHDDITAECIAQAFNTSLELHPEAHELLKAYYAQKQLPLTTNRLKMAYIPKGATLIQNPATSAPGFKIHNVHVLAGVPTINQAMLATLLPSFPKNPAFVYYALELQIRESDIAESLTRFQAQYPNIEMGSYPIYNFENPSLSYVQITFKHTETDTLLSVANELKQYYESAFPSAVLGLKPVF